MPKSIKKKAAKKTDRKPDSKAALPTSYTALQIENTLYEAFEIETNPPPAGKRRIDTDVFKRRVAATLMSLKPGQAFVIHNAPSNNWIRKNLDEAFPEYAFIVARLKPQNKDARIYLKR